MKNHFGKMVVSYIDQAIALIQGDTAAATAEKIKRQATSAINGGIVTLDGRINDLTEAVSERNEDLRKALLNNGKEFSGEDGRQAFLDQLVKAYNAVTTAEKELEKAKEQQEIYRSAKVAIETPEKK